MRCVVFAERMREMRERESGRDMSHAHSGRLFRARVPPHSPFSLLSEEAAQAGDEQFDASQLVCGGCTAGSDLHNCATHGKAYIEFKVRRDRQARHASTHSTRRK